jgi:hypothetical protein
MNKPLLKMVKVAVVVIVLGQSLVLAYFMRPIQDDYFNLESVQRMGVLGYLQDTWQYHGGNMVQFLIHCILILPTTQAFTYWNLGLFFLTTQLVCFWSFRIILSWLFPSGSKLVLFWIPLLSLAGFEGLFVPGFLGTFGFSLATLAHLWPVIALIMGLLALRTFPGSWAFAFLLGLMAGNSNLGESAFAIGALFVLLIIHLRFRDISDRIGIAIDKNFLGLSLGTLVGTAVIVAAPGFWLRASDQVGLPSSLSEFFFRFGKSFASFTADALTHPMIWVFFFFGVVSAKKLSQNFTADFALRLRVLIIGCTLIWMALIMGSTFAYPSWHQSMGMYVLLFPTFFGVGLLVNNRGTQRAAATLMVLASLVMLLTFVRIGVLGVSRAQDWDQNLVTNVCSLRLNPEAELLGAEIRYPPFDLGVEDVNTWKWMRDKYVGWVNNIPHDIKCN